MLELALLASCNSPVRNHLMGCSCVKCADRNLDLLACTAAGRCSLDICGLENTKCIIQSGTHCTEVSSLQDQVSFRRKKPLREVCRHGDHYLAQVCTEYSTSAGLEKPPPRVKKFYIIKGKSCIRVTSLSGTDKFPMPNELIFDLHPECQGGSHYLANAAGFYIIRNEDNTYLHVFDMRCTDYRHNLHESFANGLCYFATDGYFYVVKEHAEFGLVYHRTKDMRSSAGAEMFPVSPSIASIVHRLKPLNQPTNKAAPDHESLALMLAQHHYRPPPQCIRSIPDMPSKSACATLNSSNLTVIKWKNEKGDVKTFHLKASIIHKWREIGDHVVPWEKLEVWAREKDAETCCKEVLSYWLKNPPPNYPATWEGLYELLKDCELGQVAANLEKAVENAI